jgi:hypothetical protein
MPQGQGVSSICFSQQRLKNMVPMKASIYSYSCMGALSLLLLTSFAVAQPDDEETTRQRERVYSNENFRKACDPRRGLWWGCRVKNPNLEANNNDEPSVATPTRLAAEPSRNLPPHEASVASGPAAESAAAVAQKTIEQAALPPPSPLKPEVEEPEVEEPLPETPAIQFMQPSWLIVLPEAENQLIWVDPAAEQAHILERAAGEGFRVVESFSPALGGTAPEGVYRIVNEASTAGPDAYSIDYPNVWDKLQSRSGQEIRLRCQPAVDDTEEPQPCIFSGDSSRAHINTFNALGNKLVVFANAPLAEVADSGEAERVMAALGNWEESWESLDVDLYLSNYHPDFSDFRYDFNSWSKQKRYVNQYKSSVVVDISELTVISYPGEDNLVFMRFYQTYDSSNHDWEGWKELLWRKNESGQWKILFEGSDD